MTAQTLRTLRELQPRPSPGAEICLMDGVCPRNGCGELFSSQKQINFRSACWDPENCNHKPRHDFKVGFPISCVVCIGSGVVEGYRCENPTCGHRMDFPLDNNNEPEHTKCPKCDGPQKQAVSICSDCRGNSKGWLMCGVWCPGWGKRTHAGTGDKGGTYWEQTYPASYDERGVVYGGSGPEFPERPLREQIWKDVV